MSPIAGTDFTQRTARTLLACSSIHDSACWCISRVMSTCAPRQIGTRLHRLG